jgi:Spy/CpxP family protein refolding chaperone
MGPAGPGGPMGMLPMLGPRIGLTDAQRDQVTSIVDSHRDEWKALADRARTTHEALNEAITADTMDEGLIRQRAGEMGTVEADVAVARARAKAEVFQILTDEQKTRVKAMQTQIRTRHDRPQAMRERLRERFGI